LTHRKIFILLTILFAAYVFASCAQPECTIPEDCNDHNICTNDACIEGTCAFTNNTDSCDDLDACTEGDTCSDGVCSGSPVDADRDTYVSDACGGDDCDDSNADVYPGATEICFDGVDNQCQGDAGYGEEDEEGCYLPPDHMVGTWEFLRDWWCEGGPVSQNIEIYAGGTCGAECTWTLTGIQFDLYYFGGIVHYTGAVDGNTMSGTMSNPDQTGCWDADKL